jgi:hypothetical protein
MRQALHHLLERCEHTQGHLPCPIIDTPAGRVPAGPA